MRLVVLRLVPASARRALLTSAVVAAELRTPPRLPAGRPPVNLAAPQLVGCVEVAGESLASLHRARPPGHRVPAQETGKPAAAAGLPAGAARAERGLVGIACAHPLGGPTRDKQWDSSGSPCRFLGQITNTVPCAFDPQLELPTVRETFDNGETMWTQSLRGYCS